MSVLNIGANRSARKWTHRELAGRLLWGLTYPLFAWSPRPIWGWRRMLLRLFGAKIGRQVHVYPTARIMIPWNLIIGEEAAIGDRANIYNLGLITIGPHATVSQGAHLCAGSHDYLRADMPLTKPPILIGNDAWICADAFVGPGVTIGEGAIVGARAVVMKDVAPRMIVIGNPARELRLRPQPIPGNSNQI